MKTSSDIKLIFPFLVLSANVVFLMITAFISETYTTEIPFYMNLNFGFFGFSALLIIVWGWYQWNALSKSQSETSSNNETEEISRVLDRKRNSNNFRTANIEVPVNSQSVQTTESYFLANGWALPNVDEFPY